MGKKWWCPDCGLWYDDKETCRHKEAANAPDPAVELIRELGAALKNYLKADPCDQLGASETPVYRQASRAWLRAEDYLREHGAEKEGRDG